MKIVVPLVELWTALWLSAAEALVTWSTVRQEVHEVLGPADNRTFPPSAAQQLCTAWVGGNLQQRAARVGKKPCMHEVCFQDHRECETTASVPAG